MFFGFLLPLGMLVDKWMPTPCYNDAYSVGTPKWALWGKGWLKHYKTMVSPFLGRFFLVSKRTFLGLFFYGFFILVRPGILGLALGFLLLVSCLLNLLMLAAG